MWLPVGAPAGQARALWGIEPDSAGSAKTKPLRQSSTLSDPSARHMAPNANTPIHLTRRHLHAGTSCRRRSCLWSKDTQTGPRYRQHRESTSDRGSSKCASNGYHLCALKYKYSTDVGHLSLQSRLLRVLRKDDIRCV